MPTFFPLRFSERALMALGTTVVWSLAAASVAFWALHWPKAEPTLPLSAAVAAVRPVDMYAPMSKALGQSTSATTGPASAASSAHKLLGVIVNAAGQGSALIASDGQPPKAYRVGQRIQDGLTLVSLTARQARLKSSSTEMLLDLPSLDKP